MIPVIDRAYSKGYIDTENSLLTISNSKHIKVFTIEIFTIKISTIEILTIENIMMEIIIIELLIIEIVIKIQEQIV
jgi:hypothetical protein